MSFYGFSLGPGIAAATERGAFGAGPIARAWVGMVEGAMEKGLITRARSSARQRDVQAIYTRPGVIRGFVSDYGRISETKIELPTLERDARVALLERITARPLLTAQLVAGQLPQEVIDLGQAVGAPLLPTDVSELRFTCSCMEWRKPCKHGAAVSFLVGEELDRDPLLLLALRGFERPRLLAQLAGQPAPPDPARAKTKTTPALPLDPSPAAFWGFTMPFPPTDAPDAPPDLAPHFPFWTGSRPLLDVLEEFYPVAARYGRALLQAHSEAE